jgi:hypothetical protein
MNKECENAGLKPVGRQKRGELQKGSFAAPERLPELINYQQNVSQAATLRISALRQIQRKDRHDFIAPLPVRLTYLTIRLRIFWMALINGRHGDSRAQQAIGQSNGVSTTHYLTNGLERRR